MNSFTLWLGLGAGIGLWRVARSAPEKQAGPLVNSGLLLLLAALLGARLFYVGLNWGYFSTHLPEAIQFWQGGLAWPGALAGAVLALLFITIQARAQRGSNGKKITAGWLGDRLFPMLLPLTVTAWLACWQSGCAYGTLLSPGAWFGAPSLDETGQFGLRWPLQPLAAVIMIAYLGLLETRASPFQPTGTLSALAISGLLLHLLAASLLRADPAPAWYGLRYDTWMAAAYLILFLLSIAIYGLFRRAGRNHAYNS